MCFGARVLLSVMVLFRLISTLFLFSVVPLGRPTAALDGDAHSSVTHGARYHDTRFPDFCSSFRFVSVSFVHLQTEPTQVRSTRPHSFRWKLSVMTAHRCFGVNSVTYAVVDTSLLSCLKRAPLGLYSGGLSTRLGLEAFGVSVREALKARG